MRQYLRPGAYTERSDAARSGRLLLRSDVPAFIGIAEKGPLDLPVPIESFRQFQVFFGGFIGAGFLAYSVRAFFDNGGRRCRVVRVASRAFGDEQGLAARRATLILSDTSGAPAWAISASSEGAWGNRLQVAVLEEQLADSAVAAGELRGSCARVSTTAGFVRGSLVRISQESSTGAVFHFYRVVSFVDEQRQRLYWLHPDGGLGLPYDRVLEGFDFQRPARITAITYRVDVYHDRDLLAMYSGLSLVPEHPHHAPRRLGEYRLARPGENHSGGSGPVPEPIVIESLVKTGAGIPRTLVIDSLERLPLRGGRDGLAALSHRDFIGEASSHLDSELQRQRRNRGLATLDQVDEVTLVAVPDIVIRPEPDPAYSPEAPPPLDPCVPCPPPVEPKRQFAPQPRESEQPPLFSDDQIFQVQAAMVAHCERRGDRFAVIDPPFQIAADAQRGLAEIRAWRNRFDTSYAALYYPWVKVIDPRRSGDVRSVPPSGHALGQYALVDNDTGVHGAPANRPLQWVQDLSLHASVGAQALLNPLAINVLRSEGPRGIRIMGARTLSSDPDWTFINVRRLLIMVRRTLNTICQWVVFEPNHHRTRNKFQVAIASYLDALWARGALTGASREQAFFVKCDEENNPGQQRSDGQLLAEIGVAPSKPLEFVVVRVGMQENELKISEAAAAATA